MTLFEPHGFQFAAAFSLQLEATLRRPHLNPRLSQPVARWTWAGGDTGRESRFTQSRDLPIGSLRGARGAETLPGLGQWAEEGRRGPEGLVQGSVVDKSGLRPVCPAQPLRARRPGWRRAERSRGARVFSRGTCPAGCTRADPPATRRSLSPSILGCRGPRGARPPVRAAEIGGGGHVGGHVLRRAPSKRKWGLV